MGLDGRTVGGPVLRDGKPVVIPPVEQPPLTDEEIEAMPEPFRTWNKELRAFEAEEARSA